MAHKINNNNKWCRWGRGLANGGWWGGEFKDMPLYLSRL